MCLQPITSPVLLQTSSRARTRVRAFLQDVKSDSKNMLLLEPCHCFLMHVWINIDLLTSSTLGTETKKQEDSCHSRCAIVAPGKR